MISAVLLSLASVSAPVAAGAAYAAETAQNQHHATSARNGGARRATVVPCNPDPLKGRACRHHQVQAEQAHSKAVAVAQVDRAVRTEAR